MLTKIDIVWAAQALILEHGEGAATKAEQHADRYLHQGSTEGHRLWIGISLVIKELQRTELREGEARH